MGKHPRFIKGFKSLPYNPNLKLYAAKMRNNSTLGEVKFWSELLKQKKSGYTFSRQKMILNYIVDFYCAKLMLVIEIDGTVHDQKKDYDAKREDDLTKLGIKLIRYKDLDVLNNFHLVKNDLTTC